MDERLVNKLIHMRDAARQASGFIEGMAKEDFLTTLVGELPGLIARLGAVLGEAV